MKESWITDPQRDALSDGSECLGYRLTTKADDTGRFDADPRVLLANCFPLRIGRLTLKTIEKWLIELQAAGVVQLYTVDGRRYGRFSKWETEQRIYNLKSKFPDPPADCGNFPQPPAGSGSYPISGIRDSINDNVYGSGFDRFWESFPRKRSKGSAEKAWAKLKPSEQLQAEILVALEQAKTSEQWTKESGDYIPYPATWLNAKGWLDEHTSSNSTPQSKCVGMNGETCMEYIAPPSKTFCPKHKAANDDRLVKMTANGHVGTVPA